jgi:hypothetical protein
MGQECKYLPYKKPVKGSIVFANGVPFIVTVQNSHRKSIVFAFKKPIKESIVYTNGVPFIGTIQNSHGESIFFANGVPFIGTIQNSHGESYVSSFKKPLKESQLLTGF